MAYAKICDRCGVFYPVKQTGRYKGVDATGFMVMGPLGPLWDKNIDLCPSCLEYLELWMQGVDLEHGEKYLDLKKRGKKSNESD